MGRFLDSELDIIDDILKSEQALRQGEYIVIQSLIRVLEECVNRKTRLNAKKSGRDIQKD